MCHPGRLSASAVSTSSRRPESDRMGEVYPGSSSKVLDPGYFLANDNLGQNILGWHHKTPALLKTGVILISYISIFLVLLGYLQFSLSLDGRGLG